MLVERGVGPLLPILRIARCVEASEHDSIVCIKIVEQGVWEPGNEHPPNRSVQDWLPRWVLVDQSQTTRNRMPETLDNLDTVRPVPTHSLGQIRLGLWSQTDAHSWARMRACTSSHVLNWGGLTA
jgi:hypothetical protein